MEAGLELRSVCSHAAGLPTKGDASEEDSRSGSRCRHLDPGGAGTSRCKRKSRVVKVLGWQAHPPEGVRGKVFARNLNLLHLLRQSKGLSGSCTYRSGCRTSCTLSHSPQPCSPHQRQDSVCRKKGNHSWSTHGPKPAPHEGEGFPPELPHKSPQGAWLCLASTVARGTGCSAA